MINFLIDHEVLNNYQNNLYFNVSIFLKLSLILKLWPPSMKKLIPPINRYLNLFPEAEFNLIEEFNEIYETDSGPEGFEYTKIK